MTIKKRIEMHIEEAIAAVSGDLQISASTTDNAERAITIKKLAEAYDLVHRGKKGNEKDLISRQA